MSTPQGPHRSEGWDEFLDNEDDLWYDAFETVETEDGSVAIDVDHYEEFDNIQELVNFVAGTGTYEDRRGFVPGEGDKDDRLREMHNDQWKIPSELERVSDYIAGGAEFAEIDIDPKAEVAWSVSEEEARQRGKDVKYTAHFIAYDDNEEGENAPSNFYISASWYDKPPENVDVEEVFDLESISEEIDRNLEE